MLLNVADKGMISWKPGVVKSPDGNAREIVQLNVWTSSLWITKDGQMRRRFYKPVLEKNAKSRLQQQSRVIKPQPKWGPKKVQSPVVTPFMENRPSIRKI